MQPVRAVQMATHFRPVIMPHPTIPNNPVEYYEPCSGSGMCLFISFMFLSSHKLGRSVDPAAREMTWMSVPGDQLLEPKVTMQDFLKSLKNRYGST